LCELQQLEDEFKNNVRKWHWVGHMQKTITWKLNGAMSKVACLLIRHNNVFLITYAQAFKWLAGATILQNFALHRL